MCNGLTILGMRATAIAVAIGAVTASCGGGKAPIATNSPSNSNSGHDAGLPTDAMGSSGPLPATPGVILSGGFAPSAGGQAPAGGTAHLVSAGAITVGPDFQPPAVPTIGSPPANAMALSSQSLGTDVEAPGSVSIVGTVTSGGSDSVRQIVAGGDIFIGGTLHGAKVGSAGQGLTLKAPMGTVYISGAVDTSGSAGAGQSGGQLTIVAQRLVVTGKLSTAGGIGVSGGAAGAITITTTAGLFLSGEVDASGGDAEGAAPTTGGLGANISIQGSGDVVLGGVARFRGGVATGTAAGPAQGGNAGSITVDSSGTVAFTGTLDASGGAASTTGSGAPMGGTAGSLKVGETSRPMAIGLSIPLLVRGGDGQAVGGGGGAVVLEPHGGDLRISGIVDASGGGSAITPGVGGSIDGHPGPEVVNAGLDVAGQVVSNGGSILSGASGDGASGGTIKLVLLSSTGNLTIEPGSQVQTDGGGSGGTGTAGGGGLTYLFTVEGNASIHGRVFARGGDAPAPGGVGGTGGFVYVFTADGHDRMSGVLTVESDGIVDASGGTGTTGGSARNDGHAGSVALFPAVQDNEYDVEHVAVLINSDGVHGSDRGWISNLGQILAKGGKANGSGGDVIFHGKQQDGNETPIPGNVVDMSGDGSGVSGDFAGE